MSPNPAGPPRLKPAERQDTSQPLPENISQPPCDDVDFVPDSCQTSRHEIAQSVSDKLHGDESRRTSLQANSGPSPRFKLDTRGSEKDFIFASAPRHAPGHFTNRKIVPRVDGHGTHQETGHQSSSGSLPKVIQSGADCSSPSQGPTHSRSVQLPPLGPSPLSGVLKADETHKQTAPPKKIGLPFAKSQTPLVSEASNWTSPSTVLPPPPDTNQGNQRIRSPRSPTHSAQAPEPGEHRADGRGAEISSPPNSKPQSIVNEAASNTPELLRQPGGPQQTLEVIMEQCEDEPPSKSAGPPNQQPGLASPQSTTVVPPRHPSSKEWMGNADAARIRQGKQRHQMNRPVRPGPHVRTVSRSSSGSSSASGISKRRARSIRDLNVFRDRDLPEVANKVNDLWKLCNAAVKDAEIESQHKVDKYRRKLHEGSQRIASYLETINLQAQAIQSLEDQKHDMHGYIEKLEQQVQAYSGTVQGLADKCRKMKDTVDSTLKEQQELHESHHLYRKASHDVLEEIRAEKQREQTARELVERQLAAVREQMKERVRQVEIQSQAECRRMAETAQVLSRQVEEKDSQAKREMDRADQLFKQLQEYQKNQTSFDDMRAHTSEILKLLNDRRDVVNMEQLNAAEAESRTKMENMTEKLEFLKELSIPQAEAVSTFGRKLEEGVSRMVSTLETISESQNGSKESVKLLGTDLRASVNEMRQHLETRESTLTHQLEEKRDENAVLRRVIDKTKQELQALEGQLREANDTRKTQEERIHDLNQKVEDLMALPREEPEAKLRFQALAVENDNLKAELATRCSRISSLENQLIAKKESNTTEVERLGIEIARLTQLMNDREEDSRLTTESELAVVRGKYQAELQRTQEDAQERLRQAEKDRLLITDQLNEARNKLAAAEERRHLEHEKINSLQAALSEAQLRIQELTDVNGHKVSDLESRHKQDLETITVLRADLKASQKFANDMAETHSSERNKYKFLLSHIWHWARGKAEAHGFAPTFDKMWEDTEAAGELGKRFALLLESVLREVSSSQVFSREAPRADVTGDPPAHALLGVSEFLPSGSMPQELTKEGDDEGSQTFQNSFNLRPLSAQATILGAAARRVMVQSPHPGALTPVPPSIEEEKSLRRGRLQQPKPIIKRLTRSSANAAGSPSLGQDFVPASSLVSGYGSLLRPSQPWPVDTNNHNNDNKFAAEHGGGGPSDKGQSHDPQGAVAASSGIKIKLKNSKRPRKPSEPESADASSVVALPENTNDLAVDDDEGPQAKRAKQQKPKAPAASRRGRPGTSQASKQKRRSGLAAPGVVHGSFPPGVVEGSHHQPSEPKNKS